MMKLLLDGGADPNQLYFHRGASPMIGAVETGCVPCVRHLLAAGGKPLGTNNRGDGVLTIVVERGLDEIAALLKEAIAAGGNAARGGGTFADVYNAVKKKRWGLMKMGAPTGGQQRLPSQDSGRKRPGRPGAFAGGQWGGYPARQP